MRICTNREATREVTEEPTSRGTGARGWDAKAKSRETEARALAPGLGKGAQREGRGSGKPMRQVAGHRDRPSPSLAGRVFRISGMLGMGLLP